MSYKINGVAVFNTDITSVNQWFKEIEGTVGVGVTQVGSEGLFYFPKELMHFDNSCYFEITNAEYLIDYIDFAEEAVIPYPIDKDARLQQITDVINMMFNRYSAVKVAVALSLCSEIGEIREINRAHIFQEFQKDLSIHEPWTIYIIN